MADPFIGQIVMFGGNFAPRGWAFCDGQLLPIAQNSALFSILGTIYGGDGRTTFGLPDLRGRFPIHAGTGPGLSNRRLGEKGGSETLPLAAMDFRSQNRVAPPAPANAAVADSVNHMPPYQGINFIIALTGIFPSRS